MLTLLALVSAQAADLTVPTEAPIAPMHRSVPIARVDAPDGVYPADHPSFTCEVRDRAARLEFRASPSDWPEQMPARVRCDVDGRRLTARVRPGPSPVQWTQVGPAAFELVTPPSGQGLVLAAVPDAEYVPGDYATDRDGLSCRVSERDGDTVVHVLWDAAEPGAATCELPVADGGTERVGLTLTHLNPDR